MFTHIGSADLHDEESSIPSVIIVNDDDVQREILHHTVAELPAHTRSFSDVAAVIETLPYLPVPNLIITDLYMPKIDGWRFARLLRSHEFHTYNHVPILITSATYAGEEPARISRDTTASAFLALPAPPEKIIETVQRTLDGSYVPEAPSILLVDDDPTTLVLLESGFEKAGYTVRPVQTGSEAVSALEAGDFDGVILDYHLPDICGDVLLQQYASQGSNVVFLMLTADSDPGHALQWMQSGASGYMQKPVDPAFAVELYRRARRERSLLRIEEHLEERTREVQRLLEEEKMLIREIHHRVKNNLAAVSSLIALRETAVEDPIAKDVLVQTSNDVTNIAAIYESLMQSEGNRRIDATSLIHNVVKQATSQYPMVSVTLEEDVERVAIDPTVAMRLGIIVNELVTNAMKYAFPATYPGHLEVMFHRDHGNDTLRLSVSDNGRGMPRSDGQAAVVDDDTLGFGLHMVRFMVEQMGALMSIETDNGTTVTVRDIPHDREERGGLDG